MGLICSAIVGFLCVQAPIPGTTTIKLEDQGIWVANGMVVQMVGKGSQYLGASKDKDGNTIVTHGLHPVWLACSNNIKRMVEMLGLERKTPGDDLQSYIKRFDAADAAAKAKETEDKDEHSTSD